MKAIVRPRCRARKVPVTGHADDRDDLAAANGHAVEVELHRPGGAGGRRRGGRKGSDHRLGELPRAHAAAFRDDAAAAQDDDALAEGQDLRDLVADEDDARPVGREPPDDGEQLLRLGRREHGRRLVEDQQPGTGGQRLDQFELRFFTDGKLRHAGALHGRKRCLALPHSEGEGEVLRDRQFVHQHEVLMDEGDFPRCATELDRAGIAGKLAGDDAHERRLPGPVFADEADDLPLGYGKRHVIERAVGAERLADVSDGQHTDEGGRAGTCARRRVTAARNSLSEKDEA